MLTLALAAMAFSAAAQQTIIFSKPADLSADKANSFLPNTEHHSGDYNAPHSLFNDYTPDLPLPRPLLLDNNDASVKDALDKRKNWTLLTPEQILGIQTPEQVLGVPDRTGEKKLSLEEQFLLRESRESAGVATNGLGDNAAWRVLTEENPFTEINKDDENNPFRVAPQKMQPGVKYFKQLLGEQNPGTGPDEKPNSPWNSVFALPSQPKQTPDQLADMERFRALMEPSSPPEQTPVPTRFSVPEAPAADPFLQPVPVVNPAGQDISPLENAFSRPAGIKPLPGISTLPPTPVVIRPSWQAQLPPWMTAGPQAHNPNGGF
jgi:hypothetical protein